MQIDYRDDARSGSSLVETAVALSLLTAVLIPAVFLLARVSSTNNSAMLLTGRSVAREAMEEVLNKSGCRNQTYDTADGLWRLAVDIADSGEYPIVSVSVYQLPETSDAQPLVRLFSVCVKTDQ